MAQMDADGGGNCIISNLRFVLKRGGSDEHKFADDFIGEREAGGGEGEAVLVKLEKIAVDERVDDGAEGGEG